MTIEGAVIKEQGISFAVVIVKPHIVHVPTEADDMIASLRAVFGGVPVVLMAQDGRGRPTYYGREDIARFMARVHPSRVPWKRFTVH